MRGPEPQNVTARYSFTYSVVFAIQDISWPAS